MKESILKRIGRARFITIGVVVMLLTAGIYILWSVNQWRAYDNRADQQYEDTRRQLADALALPVDTGEKKDAKRVALEAASRKAKEEITCEIATIIRWQTVFESVRRQIEQCERQKAIAHIAGEELDAIVVFLRYDQKFAQLLEKAIPTISLAETAWPSELEKWKGLYAELEAMSVPEDFATVHQTTVEVVSMIQQKWAAVLTAHEANNRQKFIAAHQELTAAYDTLGTVKLASQDSLIKVSTRAKEPIRQILDNNYSY